jgi:hypothetical protein
MNEFFFLLNTIDKLQPNESDIRRIGIVLELDLQAQCDSGDLIILRYKSMKTKTICISLLVLMALFCIAPVSAAWIDHGEKKIERGTRDGNGNKMGIVQRAHYWYNYETDRWKVDLHCEGSALTVLAGAKDYSDAYGTYQVFESAEGYFIAGEQFGDKEVKYTSKVSEPVSFSGRGVIYSNTYYTKSPTKGDWFGITCAGKHHNTVLGVVGDTSVKINKLLIFGNSGL